MEQGLTPQRIVAELTRSPHGELKAYLPVGKVAAREQAEFLAHLVAWNAQHGQIRDSKVALPVVTLTEPGFPFAENSYAHLARLDPRNFVRAVRFAKELHVAGRPIRRLVERYLRARESNPGRFVRTVLAHRASLKTLYAMEHIRPHPWADSILFKGARPPGPLAAVAQLKGMHALDAAAAIMQYRIPFLSAVSALGGRAKETELVLALMDRMTPAELVTNSKMLHRLGVKDVPTLRAAYEAGLQRVAESKTVTLKTTVAAKAVGDERLKAKLVAAQEKQIAAAAVKGDWLVLGDKSSSMTLAIEVARQVAATLAKYVEGRVHLVFFDSMPRYIEVSGKSYEQVLETTKHVRAGGSTSIGCGVQYAIDRKLDVQGIAVVSDGAENTAPMFVPTYRLLCGRLGVEVPVYLYWMECHEPTPFNNDPEALAKSMARDKHKLKGRVGAKLAALDVRARPSA